MTDWIKHDGGPQPVADDVWVEVFVTRGPHWDVAIPRDGQASFQDWPNVTEYRILNQHLIDAARLEGIRLGLEAKLRSEPSSHPALRTRLRMPDPETIAKEAGR